jgi:hypothetical protein
MKSIWDILDPDQASPLYYGTGLVGFDPHTGARLFYSDRSFFVLLPGRAKKRYIRTRDEHVALARANTLLTHTPALA